MSYQVEFATKWSDFDPNRHMRHTAYNDYCAEVRIRYFAHAGFSVDEIAKDNIGPYFIYRTHLIPKRDTYE